MARGTLRIFPVDALGSFSSAAGTTAKGAWRRGTDSCRRTGTRPPLDGPPPAGAPAAAPATVAEPSVLIATEATAAQPSSSSSAQPPTATEPEAEMTDHVADRKRARSAVDLSSPAMAEEPTTVEDKRQRLQEEIEMIAAECQEEAPIEWDEDEERVWKQRRKHIDDATSERLTTSSQLSMGRQTSSQQVHSAWF